MPGTEMVRNTCEKDFPAIIIVVFYKLSVSSFSNSEDGHLKKSTYECKSLDFLQLAYLSILSLIQSLNDSNISPKCHNRCGISVNYPKHTHMAYPDSYAWAFPWGGVGIWWFSARVWEGRRRAGVCDLISFGILWRIRCFLRLLDGATRNQACFCSIECTPRTPPTG